MVYTYFKSGRYLQLYGTYKQIGGNAKLRTNK